MGYLQIQMMLELEDHHLYILRNCEGIYILSVHNYLFRDSNHRITGTYVTSRMYFKMKINVD